MKPRKIYSDTRKMPEYWLWNRDVYTALVRNLMWNGKVGVIEYVFTDVSRLK